LRDGRDSDAIRSYHPAMPMWRCPHCGTPQAETARCWVCRRSSTACATCRHFRRSVAAQLGYCGLDSQRRPLRGDEIRGCWDAATTPVEVGAAAGSRPAPRYDELDADRTPVRRLEFVEVRTSPARSRGRTATTPGTATAQPSATAGAAGSAEADAPDPDGRPIQVSTVELGWSLWGDVEP
jgi:hypothetical protein